MSYTNDEIVKIFDESSIKVAEFIGLLRSYHEKFEYISSQTMDNADPEIDSEECLKALGCLLSTLIVYKDEYSKEK